MAILGYQSHPILSKVRAWAELDMPCYPGTSVLFISMTCVDMIFILAEAISNLEINTHL
jgi:hypothetical protein